MVFCWCMPIVRYIASYESSHFLHPVHIIILERPLESYVKDASLASCSNIKAKALTYCSSHVSPQKSSLFSNL